jgi:hypothetical protein
MSKMTKHVCPFVSSVVRAQGSVRINKQEFFRRITKAFCCGLSLMLLLQGVALSSIVFAQTKRQAPVPSLPQPVTVGNGDAPPSGQRSIMPTQRPITVLPPINMQGLSQQQGLAPSHAAPRELKPIHPPKGISQRRSTVAIPRYDQSRPATPAAPVPSVHGQSPPVSRSFKSDDLQLGSIPPDTMGAVGDAHVATVTNEKIVVHDRDGVVLSTVTLDAFWAGLPPPLAAPSTFDPKILYDRFNDRFILVTQAEPQNQNSATLIAVSQTADATGTYNRIAIDADAVATGTGGKWADFPSIGFNANWITVQINLFGFGTVTGYQGPVVYVLNKAAAYNNTLSTVSAFEGSFATCLASPTPNTELGCGFTMVPHVDEGNGAGTHYLIEDWDAQFGQLRISTVTGTPAAPVLTIGTQFPQSPNSWRFNAALIAGSGGYVLQRQQNVYALSGSRVTANDSRIENAVLRNGSLWTVHHVMLPTVLQPAGTATSAANPDNHTGVQWWEINPTIVNSVTGTPPIQRAIIEDPTADNCHNNAGGLRSGCTPQGQFFTFPNIAVNQNDDVLIGYSRFSHLTLPKTAYSFRANTDTINTTRDSQTYHEGGGNYNIGAGSPFNIRWGDFSAAMVDPLNDTDFWTIQEYGDYQREIFGPGGFAGVWSTWWALVKPTTTTTTAGNLIISEFRLRGPAGVRDEFVELYNPASTPLTVTTTDGSDGWALAYSTPAGVVSTLAAIPNGTTIPAHGHYLITNEVAAAGIAPYSLRGYPNTEVRPSDADAMYTPDLADNGGVAIFRTADPANFNAGTRMDSAGFVSETNALFKEGAGILNITGTPTGQISFHRSQLGGTPQDTNNNAADFIFTDTVSELLGGLPRLGAPGPENVHSPVLNTSIFVDRFNQAVASNAPNNIFRKVCAVAEECNPNRSALGTLSIRRRVTNFTGVPVTRIRFRIRDITTLPAPAGTADLRPITSADVSDASTGGVLVRGTTLEEPPVQLFGGGWNSSWGLGVITLAAPLAPGASVNVQFLVGVQQGGSYRIFVVTEALP